ncbi:hypothetical protein E1211_17235 [Micromonospora sp. 15K316]|uniref:hypothetical protein n=1 Tax=Micromonospora sp. 15K316 TaxID=2530376 RepID=UPI0010477A70|nr:hypothetical protein [Micromonospora sp. 15K316]TDC34548.1 hypothetical protein E1211_17235 [Micromonospora sp. 15K316]
MRRTGLLGLICALVLAGLTACSAPIEGAVGVRLDPDGRLVGVFDWCRGKGAVVITLYRGVDGGGVRGKVIRLEREQDRRARETEEVVLLDPADGWRTKLAPATLDDEQMYDLRAWNEDGGAVEDFPFRVSELRDRAGPNTILTKRWEGDTDGGYVATYRTHEDFARHARTVCD